MRVLRGGSWADGPDLDRAATRWGRYAYREYSDLGFRIARTPDPQEISGIMPRHGQVWRHPRPL